MHDFRSDLMSGPPTGMDEAIRPALTTAPAFGQREDPYQIQLESKVAELMGFEDALLLPTCTIANQIALRVWGKEGRKRVLADRYCHLLTVEGHATAILNDVSSHPLDGERGHLSPLQIADQLEGDAKSSLVWLENTHMAHGGTVMPADWLLAIGEIASAHGASIHLDGSRIWNAVVRSGASALAVTRGADSLALSLTKGLGAPAGSMLLGSRDFIRRAVEVRSAFGAAWRPIGLISAAALHVLLGYEERLKEDHQWAGALANSLRRLCEQTTEGFSVNSPDTNIILIQAPDAARADELLAFLASRQVLALHFGANLIRMVVHARTRRDAVAGAAEAFEEFLSLRKHQDHATA